MHWHWDLWAECCLDGGEWWIVSFCLSLIIVVTEEAWRIKGGIGVFGRTCWIFSLMSSFFFSLFCILGAIRGGLKW